MNKQKRVLVDIDGTLNEFQNHFIFNLETKFGLEFDYSKSNDFHMEHGIKGLKPKDQKKIMALLFETDEFWETIPVLPDAQTYLKWLNDRYDVWIVTSPWVSHKNNKKIKKEWIKENFPFIDQNKIAFSSKKWLIAADVIIEDKPETIKKSQEHGLITVMMIQPYNAMDVFSDYEFGSWKDIPAIFNKIEEASNDNRS